MSTWDLGPKDLRTQGPETREPRVLRAVLHCSSYYTLTGNLCQYYQPKRAAVSVCHCYAKALFVADNTISNYLLIL